MVKKIPTVISLFAGCGGSSLGYKWAGFKELLAVDYDRNAVETFKINFPDISCWQKDIRKVSGKEILKFCKIRKGELDLLDASPPCQGFSLSGKREINDSRNDLYKEVIRLIKELMPKVFVIENVSGMIKGYMKGKFIEIMTTLKSLPYQVKCKLMNSMYYGVPQSRERLIWIGVRNDLRKTPSFPVPVKKRISVIEAFKGLPEDNSRTLNELGYKIWEQVKPGETFDRYHPKGYWFNGRKINPYKPSPTIEKTIIPSGGGGLFHWLHPRCLNIPELKRLSSFPDDFKFTGNFRNQWARIGNAVMPKFMEAIARHIREAILEQ
jgi:DNA (cytosine-5)-methyltransferase 1